MQDETKQQLLSDHFEKILKIIDPYHQRQGLEETPQRVAKAMLEMTHGYTDIDPSRLLKTFDNDGKQDMIVVQDIPFYSLCEHHLLPFTGVAHIAYVPNDRIVGLSKFARLTDVYAKRLQVQERLTAQIADIIFKCLNPIGVGVVLDARHFCMEMRGVSKQGAVTRTTALRGAFTSGIVRTEFLQSIPKGSA